MYKTKITLKEALERESMGEITLFSSYDDISFHPYAPEWKNNYIRFRKLYSNVNPEKFFQFLQAHIYVEIPHKIDDETYEWVIIRGKVNKSIQKSIKDDIEYVYILTNPGYPEYIKIGMTEKTVEGRVKGINATSTIHEWVPKFALPIEKGMALKIEHQMHKCFAHLRINSDQGNEREFFMLDPLTAFDKLREIGALFQVGNPIIY
jgi:hypothetical protein